MATGQRLVQAAELAQHCSGEDAYDDERGQFLQRCVSEAMAEARQLLPLVEPGALPPGDHAAARLYVDPSLGAAERASLCRQLPAGDFMAGLLDDEVQLGCGAP